jgi:hypothetical protein
LSLTSVNIKKNLKDAFRRKLRKDRESTRPSRSVIIKMSITA